MCCIVYVKDDAARPDKDTIQKLWDTNSHGAGIAWREEDKKGKVVVWRKGFEAIDEIRDLMLTVPTPYVAHFRIQTIGGERPELTHPFPVDVNASLALKGRTNGYVLFHNGNWSNWDEACRYAALTKGLRIPRGKWSDTRAMAWLCAHYGEGFMEFLPNQKALLFGPNDIEFHWGAGWKNVAGALCSNDNFASKRMTYGNSDYNTSGPTCKESACWRKDNLKDGYCPLHVKKEVKLVTPGSAEVAQGDHTPFHQQNTQGPCISVAQAEELRKHKLISKKLYNSVKLANERMEKGSPLNKKLLERLAFATAVLNAQQTPIVTV